MGIEDVVDGKVAQAPEIVEAPPEPTPEVPLEGTPEAPPAEASPAEAVVQPPVVEEPREDKSVPLATFLDMRDARKAAEERARQLEQRLQQSQPEKMPDPYDDPDGFRASVEQQVDARVTNQRFEMSKLLASQAHGEEAVDGAIQWAMEKAQADPTFGPRYMREVHPIDWIVRQQKREGLLSQIEGTGDLDAFVKNYVAQNGEKLGLTVPAAPMAAVPQQAPVSPPRSIASAPSVGGAIKDVPVGPIASLEAIFPR